MKSITASLGLVHDLAYYVSWWKPKPGQLVLVGGCVRDMYVRDREAEVKDIDVEIYGMPAEEVERLLVEHGIEFDVVGRSFAVFKLKDYPIDISLPRRERKVGAAHTDFVVESDPDMTVDEAASRRDFTINTVSYDPLTRKLIDPFHGAADLKAGVLRHTSDRFSEDPLRVLRAAQFIARFELEPTYKLVQECRKISDQFDTLSKERVYEEFNKLLLKGRKIGDGLRFLRDCGWLRHFPELACLQGIQQDPIHHPEGDVFVHTCHCLDAFAAARTGNNEEDLLVGYAVLGHDFGKATTTTRDDNGKIHAYGHEEASGPLLESFLSRLTNQREFIEQAVKLAQAHMRPVNLYNDRASLSAIRRLSQFVGRLDLLMRVVRADQEGRPPLKANYVDPVNWVMTAAANMRIVDSRPKPLVLGRHLIELGLTPGPMFKVLLDRCFEDQLDGVFVTEDEGKAHLRDSVLPQYSYTATVG